jgi:uncharacterized protein
VALTIEPPPGEPYHRLQAGGRSGVGRTILGVIAVGLGGFIVLPLLVEALFTAGLAIAGKSSAQITAILDTDHLTPTGLANLNISLAAIIPVVLLVSWLVNGLAPGWVVSVVRRIRWRWFLTCLGLAVITLFVTVLVSSVLPDQGDNNDLSGSANPFTHTMLEFLLVILLLTPLQAAGEEFCFRGYLTQAFGGVFGRWPRLGRALAVLGPALLFALAHGTQNVPLFFDRFAFGLVSGILVIATGGLEAGIAMHVLNNFLAFGSALFVGDISTSLSETSAGWWEIPVTLTQSLVYLALAYRFSRQLGLATTSAGPASKPDSGSDFVSPRASL